MLNAEPGNVIFFYDELTKIPPGLKKTGCNQTGVFVDDKNILFCRGRKVVSIHKNKLLGTKVVITQIKDKALLPNISEYFKASRHNYRLFRLGIRALALCNFDVFKTQVIMPYFNEHDKEIDHENAWNRVISKLQISDLIFTVDSKSILSRIIAAVDEGSWSHCGIYIGNNEIFEVTSKGAFTRAINVYNKKNIHLGIYRHYEMINCENFIDDFVKDNTSNNKYPYIKAFVIGFRTYFGLADSDNPEEILTPNGLVYRGDLILIDYL
jgi:hypothetical protein